MSSSTFEVRETENEDDKVLEFGLETCEENEISVSASIDEVPKDHTYTKEPDIDEVDIFENECVPDSQPEENNEVTESSETQEQKNIKSKKSKKPTSKSKVKKVQSPKKETSSKKGKLKKDIVSEDNNKNEDNGIEEKSDEKTNEKIDEHPRSRKKAQKRKVEEKENVLDTSIVEDIENITEESQLIEENSGQTKKKKTSDSSDESEKEKKVKKEISSVEDTEDTTNLPKGWVRKSVVRKSGKSKGQVDIYIYSPDGIKFRSKPDIAAYIARTKAPVKLEDFDFSRKRGSAIIEAQTKSQPKKKKPEPIKSKPTVEKKSSPKKVSPRKPAKLLVKLNVSSKSKKDKSGEKSDKQSKNKSSVKKELRDRNSNVEDGGYNLSDIIIEDIISIELEKESDEVLTIKMDNGKQQPLKSVETSRDCISSVSFQCSQVNAVSDHKVEKIPKSVRRKSFQKVKKQKCNEWEKRNDCTDSIIEDIQKISSHVNENLSQTQMVGVKSHTAVDKEVEELTSTLPDGWCSESRQKSSKSVRKGDIYLYSPDGITISSRLELASYLKKSKSSLCVSDFYIKKIIPGEKICDAQISYKKHSTDIKEIVKETKKACVLMEKLPMSLPEKSDMAHEKNLQGSSRTKLDLLAKPNVFLKNSAKDTASENNECANKSCIIEHPVTDNKNPDSQVNIFKNTESSSFRPRRAIIRKSACELLNLPRKVKTEPKVIDCPEDHEPFIEKRNTRKSELCHSATVEEPKKDNFQNCTPEKYQIKDQASKEIESEDKVIEHSATAETEQISTTKPLSSFKKQSKRKRKGSNVSEGVISHGNLPHGWKTSIIKRKKGKTAGQVDIYVVSPEGYRFRSKPDLAAFLLQTKSALSIENFSFSRKSFCKESS